MARRWLLREYQNYKDYTLKMDAACSSEAVTLVYQTEGSHSPEDHDKNRYSRRSTILHTNKSIPTRYLKKDYHVAVCSYIKDFQVACCFLGSVSIFCTHFACLIFVLHASHMPDV